MLTSGNFSYEWANATQGIVGQIVYVTSAGKADFTTGLTLEPRGVLLNAPKQGETAQINFPAQGDVVLMLCNGTTDLVFGDRVKTNSTGRGVKATKSATQIATVAWTAGAMERDFAADVDGLCPVRWLPQEGDWT